MTLWFRLKRAYKLLKNWEDEKVEMGNRGNKGIGNKEESGHKVLSVDLIALFPYSPITAEKLMCRS